MSGRDKSADQAQKRLAEQNEAERNRQIAASNEAMLRMQEYQRPLANFYTGMASSDPTTRLIAGSIPLGEITKAQRGAEQSIFDTVGEGPARDFALSQAKRQGAGQKYQTMNDLFLQSLTGLSGMGQQQGELGMQQLAAGSRFGESAAQGQQALAQQAAQRKAATMGAIGQLASIGGSLATGGLFGGGGGRAASPISAQSWSAMNAMPKQVPSFGQAAQYLPGRPNSWNMGW